MTPFRLEDMNKEKPKTMYDYQWLFETRPGIALRTYRYQADVINRIICFFGRDKEPRNVFQHDVLRYRDSRLKTCHPAIVRKEMQTGLRFFNWLIEQDIIENWFNPFRGVKVKG